MLLPIILLVITIASTIIAVKFSGYNDNIWIGMMYSRKIAELEPILLKK